jgi:hypothetical protein
MNSECVGRDCVKEINGIRLPDDIAAVVDSPIWRLNHPPHVLTNTFPGLGNLREGQLFPLKRMKFENAFDYDEEMKNDINFWRYCTTGDDVKEGWINIDKSILIGCFFMEDSLIALEASVGGGPRISYLLEKGWAVVFKNTGDFINFLRLNPPL